MFSKEITITIMSSSKKNLDVLAHAIEHMVQNSSNTNGWGIKVVDGKR